MISVESEPDRASIVTKSPELASGQLTTTSTSDQETILQSRMTVFLLFLVVCSMVTPIHSANNESYSLNPEPLMTTLTSSSIVAESIVTGVTIIIGINLLFMPLLTTYSPQLPSSSTGMVTFISDAVMESGTSVMVSTPVSITTSEV